MQRPFFFVVIFLACGMIAAHWWPSGMQPAWLLIPIGMAFLSYWWMHRKGKSKMPAILALSLVIGVYYSSSYQLKSRPMLDGFVDQPMNVRGRVEGDPIQRGGGWAFRMSISEVQVDGQWKQVSESAMVKLEPYDIKVKTNKNAQDTKIYNNAENTKTKVVSQATAKVQGVASVALNQPPQARTGSQVIKTNVSKGAGTAPEQIATMDAISPTVENQSNKAYQSNTAYQSNKAYQGNTAYLQTYPHPKETTKKTTSRSNSSSQNAHKKSSKKSTKSLPKAVRPTTHTKSQTTKHKPKTTSKSTSKSASKSPFKTASKSATPKKKPRTHAKKQTTANSIPSTPPPPHPADAFLPDAQPTAPLQYGDLLQLSLIKLEKPSPARNPGGFDAAKYDKQQGIAYTITCGPHSLKITGRDDHNLTGWIFNPIRQKLLAVIQQEFSAQDSAVVAGLVLGITDQIDPTVMNSFRLLGVVHILAVSGANVAMMIMPLLRLLGYTKLSSTKKYVLCAIIVFFFSQVCGGGASVVRACAMSVMWCIGRLARRESDTLTAWSVAAILTLLLNPLAVFDVGFQLTYLITLGVLFLPNRLRPLFAKLPDRLANPLVMTITAELISVPILLSINPAYTPLSLLANLYIEPLVELLVPVALFAILLGLIHPVLTFLPAEVVKWLLYLLIHPLNYVGQAGWLVRNYRPPSANWLCAYYCGWALFALRKLEGESTLASLYAKGRTWGLALCFAMCAGITLFQLVAPRDLRVVYLDVGQGDSSLIEMPKGSIWLVDGGGIPGFQHSTYDVGEKVVVPALAAEGIDRIDVMVMTHADEDHVRGLLAVLRHFTVKKVVVSDTTTPKAFYQELLGEVKQQQIPLEMAQAGQVWTPETGITVHFLNPPAQHYIGTRSDTNSNSVVFSLDYRQRSFLFMADYEGEVEPYLPINRHIDVLKVAHHGSGYSTFTPLLQRITPKIAVVSVGAHNHYGHPNKGTLQRLQDIGAQTWRTDQQGAIVCETDGYTLQMNSWLGGRSYEISGPSGI